MNFELTKEQIAIKDTVREFAEKELKPIAIENDENKEFPIEVYKKLGEMGILGLPFPEEYGGTGGGYLPYVLAVEEISKVHASMGIAYSVNASLCAGAIFNNASEELKKKYLPDLLSGKKIGAFNLTEPEAGSDAGNASTTAVKDGDHYIINGVKCFSTNAPLADTFVVFAKTDPEKGSRGMSAFIVEKDFPGITIGEIENKSGINAAQVSDVIYNNCRVPAENLIAEEGQGLGIGLGTLDGGRIGVAAQALGIAQGAFEIARDYLKERVQFGKPLYKNQYLSFKMAELYLLIEQARYMVYKAALDKDAGRPYSLSAAMAKLACSDAAMRVTVEAVQMLGGNGYMKGYHVERMMRDAKITQIYEGTNEVQKMIIGGSIFR